MKNIVFLATFFMAITLMTAPAFAVGVRDSYYYMKDDGIFSEAEKDEEAVYIYKQCKLNATIGVYFDCGCIAGAFRMQREGELVPQDVILQGIYHDEDSQCANPIGIAGEEFNYCLESYQHDINLSRRGINAAQMCTCYANEVATRFSKKPKMNTKYMSKIKGASMLYCRSPKALQAEREKQIVKDGQALVPTLNTSDSIN